MDVFMNHVIDALKVHGALAIRVFPPDSGVLLAFADRLSNEVVRFISCPMCTALTSTLGRRICHSSSQPSAWPGAA